MKNKIGPIKPEEVLSLKKEGIPDEVFEVFNALIAQSFRGGQASIKLRDVVEMLEGKGLKRDEAYQKGWLDIEGLYRKAGWKVVYDSPGYNESYDAYYVFSKGKPGQ